MKNEIIDISGKKTGEITLNSKVFDTEINKYTIYESIKNYLANQRQGTHSTKTISTVAGTTRKPWRQKGTGRARAGTNKSPLWKGGAVIFGPHPRDYSYSIPKKIRQKGIFSVLTALAKEKQLKVIEDFELKEYKTKKIIDIFSRITKAKKVIFILEKESNPTYEKIKKSASNIPWLKTMNTDSLNIHQLFYADEVVITKNAVEKINKRYK